MGKLAIYEYISFMFLVITVLLAIFTIFGLFGGEADPARGTALAMLVYVLPLLIIGDCVMLLFWLIRRRWHWLVIPGVAILCSIPYIGTLYQVKLFSNEDSTQAGIKVASFNVECLGREVSGFKAQDILTMMKSQNVDILCMQEYYDISGDKLNSDSYKSYFTYMAKGRQDMVIYSRYPILNSGIIDFGKTNNSGLWADIDINSKEVRVFNLHLETTGINRSLYQASMKERKGQKVESNAILKSIYGTYTWGMGARARQADQVAQLIKKSELPVIVCGDFNDVPYSYTYNTVLGDLVDGFKECGSGLMYTRKRMRIDYIFHDKEIEGETFYKLDVNYSDHIPVFIKVKL